MKQMNETNYLQNSSKQLIMFLHVIKFANRLYRVTVLYSLYYPKLKQTY